MTGCTTDLDRQTATRLETNVLSLGDLFSRPDNMDETVLHTLFDN